MLLEFPEYYENFHCIGGVCPDSCCAGWEVDVDAESCDYYQTVPGRFGERLRRQLISEGEERYFPLTGDRRCPFLNRENLCEIYIELGEEALCQVCTEYPRYFMEAGQYQQMDMSLSCMELSRIFFSEEGPIRYFRAEDASEGEVLSSEEEAKLAELLSLRNACIAFIQEGAETGESGDRFWDSLTEMLSAVFSEQREVWEGTAEGFLSAALSDLPQRFRRLETLDKRWTDFTAALNGLLEWESAEALVSEFRLVFRTEYGRCFRRLAAYFLFRYCIDSFYEDSMADILRLLLRSLRTIELMAAVRLRQQGSYRLSDMIDTVHLFSKEVEHAEENVACFKSAEACGERILREI